MKKKIITFFIVFWLGGLNGVYGQDIDGDLVQDQCDFDNDNDGILDIIENSCTLSGQTIRIGYIPDSRDLDTQPGFHGYTFDGMYMSGSSALKLTNPANFGPSGTVKATIVLVPINANPITKASITGLNLNAIFLGGIDNSSTSYLSNSEFVAIKDWSDDSPKNFVVATQFQTPAWGASIKKGNVNPDTPVGLAVGNKIFNGPFGSIRSFNQGGGFQAYFGSSFNPCFAAFSAVDARHRNVMHIDNVYNDLLVADVDTFTTLGGVTPGGAITSNNDRLFANIFAFVANQSACAGNDLDGDGIPNYLDNDSDADGCFDAIEGDEKVSLSQVDANGKILGKVDSHGIPILVNSGGAADIGGDQGQGVGFSADSSVSSCLDKDEDAVQDNCDLDNDNDGILDIVENSCALSGQTIRVGYIQDSRDLDTQTGFHGYTFDGMYMSGSSALKLTNPANFGPSGTVKADIVLVPITDNPITKASITSLNLNAVFLGGIDNGSSSYLSDSELLAIKDWSNDSLKNFVISTQFQTKAWGADIISGNVNPDFPVGIAGSTKIFSGPFGSINSFNQGGSFQAYFSSGTTSCFANTIAVDRNNRPVIYFDAVYNDLLVADVDIFTVVGGITPGSAITSNSDRLFANIWAFVASQSACAGNDLDGDGIPNYLDLDSDGDGCFDAIEGDENVSPEQIDLTGTILGNVDVKGVPVLVDNGGPADMGGDEGQGVGDAADSTIKNCYCYKPSITDGNVLNTNFGITALNRAGAGEETGNWPMLRKGGWIALEALTKSFVPNRLSSAEISAIPAANLVEGMMVYNTTLNCLQINIDGTASGWKCFNTQTCP
ncbi:hypothetical protein ACM46_12675 [Chryseobacterium angstadtii]|uniref:Uncharacterized protein n=1 Tax=Chryseobacterium angstadtii TaxID=558151 RepID=A0A0J7IF10_9FLAO|nr:hypothetical protein [Chryseobacterium angstadtii]KMQ65043.1 hypothetical protein ACM46_12675 [Chryseobacterium angstadtii]